MLKLSDFKPITDQLREMEVSEETSLAFKTSQMRTVYSTITRLKNEDGLDFTTRKYDGNVYVWRLK
jgi:hypothetical protein